MAARRGGFFVRHIVWLCGMLPFVVLPACLTDHDALALRPHEEAPREEAGTAPSAASEAGSDAPGSGSTTTEGGAGQSPSEEAGEGSGSWSLTLVHGVTDEPSHIAFCFAAVRDGAEVAPEGAPVPASGLAFGGSTVLDALTGVDLHADGFQPYVIAGDLARIQGLGCAEALELGRALEQAVYTPVDDGSAPADAASPGGDAAGPLDASLDAERLDAAEEVILPPIRVRPLPVLPAGTLAPSESYLMVLGGCIGGPAFTDPSERSVCGELYVPQFGTLSTMLVTLSRETEADKVGLQFLNGSVAISPVELRAVSDESSSVVELTVASDVVTGEIEPPTPRTDRAVGQLGILANTGAVAVRVSYSTTPVYEEPWSRTLEAGGVATLQNGASYTLVLVGPYPGFDRNKWWNGAVVTVVPNEPP